MSQKSVGVFIMQGSCSNKHTKKDSDKAIRNVFQSTSNLNRSRYKMIMDCTVKRFGSSEFVSKNQSAGTSSTTVE